MRPKTGWYCLDLHYWMDIDQRKVDLISQAPAEYQCAGFGPTTLLLTIQVGIGINFHCRILNGGMQMIVLRLYLLTNSGFLGKFV